MTSCEEPYNSGRWTEGRFKAFITSTIRSGFRRWPVKFDVLKNALVGKEVNPKTGRMANMYKCKKCKGKFTSKEVQVDHIKPVVGKEGFISWDKFIENLFCEEKNLQVLCLPCHKEKSKKETDQRKKHNEVQEH